MMSCEKIQTANGESSYLFGGHAHSTQDLVHKANGL